MTPARSFPPSCRTFSSEPVASADHKPVLLDEALEALRIVPNGCYIDATFGRGGHSGAILRRLGEGGRLIAIDRDEAAVAWGEKNLAAEDGRLSLVRGAFDQLAGIAKAEGVDGEVDGVLMDLGVSSPQLDDAERGFSFLRDGPLDMRMDRRQPLTAAAWLARASEKTIADILRRYGDERYAGRIARAIVDARGRGPIARTGQLAEIVAAANPRWEEGRHPATRTFQAIRIHINEELDMLKQGLAQALEVLRAGGRLAVISFHSLEDRIVKRFMRDAASGDTYPRGLPVTAEAMRPKLRVLGKALAPTAQEVAANPRARSARLRVAERLA